MDRVRWVVSRSALTRPGTGGTPRLDRALDAMGIPFAYDRVPDGWAAEPGPVVAWGLFRFMGDVANALGDGHGPLCGKVGHRTAYGGFAHELGPYLLNDDYVILPLAEVARRGVSRDTFIRPDTGAKLFRGRGIEEGEFSQGLSAHPRFSAVPPETPCVVASAKLVDAEHKFVVAGGKVVDGRRYRTHGVCDVSEDVAPEAAALAAEIAGLRWQAAPAYALDVAMSEGRARLVDVDPFGSCPLLDMDTRRIAEAVSAAVAGAPTTSRRIYWAA